MREMTARSGDAIGEGVKRDLERVVRMSPKEFNEALMDANSRAAVEEMFESEDKEPESARRGGLDHPGEEISNAALLSMMEQRLGEADRGESMQHAALMAELETSRGLCDQLEQMVHRTTSELKIEREQRAKEKRRRRDAEDRLSQVERMLVD